MGIKRPNLEYNDAKHEYRLNGVKLDGVSSVAKVGEDEVWGVAAAWAWRIGYEGAHDLLAHDPMEMDKETLRNELKHAKKTPWARAKESQDRGTAIHDALEILAQKGVVPTLDSFPEAQHGFVQALCRWYVDYRPEFVATEVQVVSEKHGFAGRYDIRAKVQKLILNEKANWQGGGEYEDLLLIDLKTGKKVYPTSQYVQLAGYELASREMGYPETDAQYILNVHADGSYDFSRSTARMQDFITYLEAYRTIKRIKEGAKSA